MRALVLLKLQRKLHTNMHRTLLLGYLPQPACSSRPADCVSGETTFVMLMLKQMKLQCQSFSANTNVLPTTATCHRDSNALKSRAWMHSEEVGLLFITPQPSRLLALSKRSKITLKIN